MGMRLPIDEIKELTGANSVKDIDPIQSLWSGYGEIFRARLLPNDIAVVVKYVQPPVNNEHKYGWHGSFGHQRKLNSYRNELAWYRYGVKSQTECRTAKFIAGSDSKDSDSWLFILEDLDASGYPVRRNSVNERQLSACLRWLAGFHASFLVDSHCEADSFPNQIGVASIGTYWHLATRPEEFNAMPNGELKDAASRIDTVLNQARFQSLVHGDAKLANFCFSNSDEVAAVDFQYVGGGCGMKDLAYFVSSCFGESECEQKESKILDAYFHLLRERLYKKSLSHANVEAVEAEWRQLYPFAWADFYRFLIGWSPGHRKIHRYSERLAREVIASL